MIYNALRYEARPYAPTGNSVASLLTDPYNDYVFFAGYTVLQFVVLATAWNILGGYTGYVNFGSAAFFALGAYATVFMHKLYPLPIPLLIAIGGIVSGIVGFGMGYLTLRLRGAFFAIATLALAVVLQTLVVNWDYVGGSRGAYIIRPNEIAVIGPYIQYLFLLMLALSSDQKGLCWAHSLYLKASLMSSSPAYYALESRVLHKSENTWQAVRLLSR